MQNPVFTFYRRTTRFFHNDPNNLSSIVPNVVGVNYIVECD